MLRRVFRALRMELREHSSSYTVYMILRILVICVAVFQFINKNYESFFLCILTLVMLMIPGLLQAPSFVCEIVAFSFIAIFAYDVTVSFNEAMDLREVLESLSENNETVKRLERRFDAIVAFTPVPDMEELRELKLNAKEALVYNVERLRWKNEERINRIRAYIQLPEFDELPDRQELLEKLEYHRKRMMEKSNKQFLRAMNQLKRNPGVKSETYQEMLELLDDLRKKHD